MIGVMSLFILTLWILKEASDLFIHPGVISMLMPMIIEHELLEIRQGLTLHFNPI